MKFGLLLISILLLSGCATYSNDIQDGLDLAYLGQWKDSETVINEVLDSPQDTLLNLLERGALAHYQGDYERSNNLLEKADTLSDTFFEKSFVDRSWAILSNPRQGSYTGSGVERIYISYFKSLNYLALADQAPSANQRLTLLDSALVESRRVDLKLNEISALTPSYEDLNDKNKAFYTKALDFLSGFYTGSLNSDNYLYREDAWARYLEGIQYESSQSYDDARIAYQKSAELYEQGYTKQYELPPQAAERAWLDTIRMMRKSGGWNSEIPRLIDSKLSPEAQEILAQYEGNDAEVVVLEHQGFMPPRQEMSLLLYGDPFSQSLVLEPLHGGGNTETNDAFYWFTMVYADINPLNMFANYKAGKGFAVIDGIFTKRIILGNALWNELDNLNIDDMLLDQPMRVTIPYYKRFTLDQSPTQLLVDVDTIQTTSEVVSDVAQKESASEPESLMLEPESLILESDLISKKESNPPIHGVRMTSLADIAMQDQLSRAQQDIYEGLIREMLRNWLSYQLQSSMQDETAGLLIGLIGKVAVFASSSAETRNWLTLPAQVRLTRTPTKSGEHQLRYRVNNKEFQLNNVQIPSDSLKVWSIRNPN